MELGGGRAPGRSGKVEWRAEHARRPTTSHTPRTGWTRYYGYVREQRWTFALLCVLVPLDVFRQLASPALVRLFIDAAVTDGPVGELTRYAVWFLALAAGGLFVATWASWAAARTAWRATNRLRADLVDHTLGQGPEFFLRHPPGELVDRVDGDVTRLASLLSTLVVDMAAQLLLIVGILVALFLLDWRYGVIFTPFALAMLVLLRRLFGRAAPLITERRRAETDLLGFLEEAQTGREEIRANGGTGHVMDVVWQRIRWHYRCARRAAWAAVTWPATVQVLTAVNFSAALTTGFWLHQYRGASIGTVFAGLSYAVLLRLPLTTITTRFQDVEDVVVSVRRLNGLFAEANPVRDGGSSLPPGPKDVAFNGVVFAYDDRPVLSDVSFTLPAGRRLALVGRTGGGKTTIMRLLFRQYDPQAGTVSVGGIDLRKLDVSALRSRLTLVSQDVHVMAATLRDNLTFFSPGVSDDRLRQALRDVGLDAWYAALPNGLDTRIGTGGGGLSAGEEQLIAVARALLTEPDVVLLDEPSARLDPHHERLLHRTIARFVEGRTAIIIAHRPETLRLVDEVMVVDDGRIARFEGWEAGVGRS